MWTLRESIFFWSAMAGSWISIGTIAWLTERIERHVRNRHPVHAADFYPILPPVWPRTEDEHGYNKRRAEGRGRFRKFIAGGGLAVLADPKLERLLTIRRVAYALCAASCAATLSAPLYHLLR